MIHSKLSTRYDWVTNSTYESVTNSTYVMTHSTCDMIHLSRRRGEYGSSLTRYKWVTNSTYEWVTNSTCVAHMWFLIDELWMSHRTPHMNESRTPHMWFIYVIMSSRRSDSSLLNNNDNIHELSEYYHGSRTPYMWPICVLKSSHRGGSSLMARIWMNHELHI